MREKILRKFLVIGLIVLFIGASFTPVLGDTEKKIITKKPIKGPSGNVQLGDPQSDGTFTIFVTFTSKHKPTGHRYTSTNAVSAKDIKATDTAVEKADKVRDAINKSGLPVTGEGKGSSVEVRPKNDDTSVSGLKCKDTTQQSQKGESKNAGHSFWGQPPFSNYPLKFYLGEFYELSINPEGKDIPMIHAEIVSELLAAGFNAMLDVTGLAFYVLDVDTSGLQSENDDIIPYSTFPSDFWGEEPFNIFTGNSPNQVGEPGETLKVDFELHNFRPQFDLYDITITDQLGWDIYPNNIILDFGEWESKDLIVDVDIPSRSGENIITLTATSVSEPWRINSTSVQLRAGNDPPTAPDINGQTNGAVDVEYTYTFEATDPDGDEVFYTILWGDGCPAVEWIGPFESGEVVSMNHTFTSKGTFTITSQAKDVYGAEGDWGTLEVTIPRNRAISNPLVLWFLERVLLLERLLSLIKMI